MITRLVRILKHWLPIILLSLVAGISGAFLLTSYLNAQIRPTFEGTARVYLTSAGGGDGRAFAPDLSLTAAEEAAIEANQDFLDLRHGIRADPSTGSIQFIASARTEEAAITEASDMRTRYLVATAPAPIEDQIADVLEQAHFVREELDALLPAEVVAPTDPAAVTQYTILSEQIRSLNTESAKLAVELVLADTESEKTAIQADLDLILGQIVDLRNQLEALPPEAADSVERGGTGSSGIDRTDAPDVAPSNVDLDDQFRIESLQSLYATLLTEFQSLYIQSVDATPQALPQVEVVDETPDPVAIPLGVGVGLAISLLLVVGAVLVIDRLRPRWWTQQELPSPLAEVPDRRCDTETWYWSEGPSKRKSALQRAAVKLLPTVEAGPAAVGLIGRGVTPSSMRNLGFDLGAVMVTSGRRTLVVDTTGLENDEEAPVQFSNGAITVGDMLNPWQNGSNGDRAAEAVTHATTLWPGLSAIGSGPKSLYSVEGAMTPVVGKLIGYARSGFALTMVPVADRGGALTEALARTLDAVVVVGRGGKTKLKEAERLLETLRIMGKPVLGTLLIVRPPRRPLREWMALGRRRKPKPDSGSALGADSGRGSDDLAASSLFPPVSGEDAGSEPETRVNRRRAKRNNPPSVNGSEGGIGGEPSLRPPTESESEPARTDDASAATI